MLPADIVRIPKCWGSTLGSEVELIAEGQREELEAFRKAIPEAGLDNFIQYEDLSWCETKDEFRGFEIVR